MLRAAPRRLLKRIIVLSQFLPGFIAWRRTVLACPFAAGLLCFAAAALAADGEGARSRLDAVLSASKLRASTAVSVFDLQSKRYLFRHNSDQSLKPASVLKILTSAVALKELGPEHRFETGLYADAPVTSGRVENLYVRGGGDPSLTVESVWNIARQIKRLGIKKIGRVNLDPSLFAEDKARVGQRAYQTGASALAFNHNSIGFFVCPGVVGGPARVVPDPEEVELRFVGSIKTVGSRSGTFAIDETFSTGGVPTYRLSGSIPQSKGCKTYYRSVADPLSYLGTALSSLLREQGIDVSQGYRPGITPSSAQLIYQAESKPVSDIVWDLNHFSNNFVAEQLLFAISSSRASRLERAAGIQVIGDYLKSLGIDPAQVRIVDASGLSHSNRVSADTIVRVLADIAEDERVRPEFENSLSVAGRSGTLKERDFGNPEILLRGKTGTLDGVSSLAGYLRSRSGRQLAFAVLINQARSKAAALRLEDSLVGAMYAGY